MASGSHIYQFSPEIRRVLEASKISFGVFQVIDGEYRALLVSEGACALFGLGHEKLMQYLSNKSYRRAHPDDAGKLLEASRNFTVRDENITVCRMLGSDGKYHPILFHERAHTGRDGTKLYVVTYTDLDKVREDLQDWSADYNKIQNDRLLRDDVTGLPNINYYHQFAPGTLKQFTDQGIYPLVVLFDIQGMHFYNDRFGYEAGDRLIREVSRILKNVFPDDFCVRYMEDHFVVITGDRDIEERMKKIRRMLKEFANGAVVDINAGVYEYKTPGESSSSAVDRARHAADYIHRKPDVYLCRYTDEVEESFHRQNYVMSHYREAIKKGWIKVYYQSLINSLNGKVSHAEALSRWIDPRYGFLNPADFIGILEENHRLWELDLYVLETVCKDIYDRREAGKPYLKASVNLSRHDLDVEDIHERINGTLAKYAIRRSDIAIEITESALVDHEELIADHINKFHEDGYQVWQDDFGSGYSSFNALQNFDFDLLKIDMQFLRHENGRTPQILTHIVDLTKKLGIQSVTEGVETERQSRFLKKIGCGMFQGFYYSKPVDKDVFFDAIAEKGLEMESLSDYSFYQKLHQVNVTDSDRPLPSREDTRLTGWKSLTIMMDDDGQLKTLYTNDKGEEWLRKTGQKDLKEASRLANEDAMPIHHVMKKCFSELDSPGDVVSHPVEDPSFNGRMEVELIVKDGKRKGFLIMCTEGQ